MGHYLNNHSFVLYCAVKTHELCDPPNLEFEKKMLFTVFVKCFLITVIICTVNVSAKRKKSKNKDDGDVESPPPPSISIDALGNCFAPDYQLKGRCVRYQNCPSAVRDWTDQQKQPLTCYYTAYENFICCTDPQVQAQPPLSAVVPTVAPITSQQQQQPHQSPGGNNDLPKSTRAGDQEGDRISDEECANVYSSKTRRKRSKRQSNNQPVEENVKKVERYQTEAVGGVPANADEFPYMCALGWKSPSSSSKSSRKIVYNCGCVLIARKYALTAAHCASIGGESPSVVRLGGGDLEDDDDDAEMIKVKRITQHPDYNMALAYNDIAIIKLAKSSREQPACLWSKESLPQEKLTAIGYGQTKFGGAFSKTLLKVFLNAVNNEECEKFYKPNDKLPNGLDAGQMCAGDPQGKMDTCQGDSGGPLLIKSPQYGTTVPYIVGLTSFGEGCASGTPSVYTKISNYLDWIESIVWK